MKRVADELGTINLISKNYDEIGKFSSSTIARRFGSWNNALEKAGMVITFNVNILKKDLFENLEAVWIKLGNQPKKRDMRPPLSKYSERGYVTKFGSWRRALESFVEFINNDDQEENHEKDTILSEQNDNNKIIIPEIIYKHRTKRIPSERLKVQVLMRDGNKCKLCGITVTGDNIHFDHVKPWSKGGETILENLQVLCAKHNIAKSDLEYSTL